MRTLGDEATFEGFCEQQWPKLVAALTYLTGDPAAGEELAQEAMVRALEHWDRVKVLESPGGWVYRVGANLAKSRWRHLRVRARRTHLTAETADGHDVAATAAETVDVRRAVLDLPSPLREAIVLRHVAGFSVEEAAAAAGVSPEALRTRSHRAVQVLRTRLHIHEPVERRGVLHGQRPDDG